MPSTPQWIFGPFRLDATNACLWHEDELLDLRPKAFAVLTYLVAHAGQLVTKEALFEAVWPGMAVSDTVLKASIGQLRQALGETVAAPQYIATVHRRGYRFIAPVRPVEPSLPAPIKPSSAPLPAGLLSAPPLFFGKVVLLP